MSEQATTPELVERARRFGEALDRRDFEAATSDFASGLILRVDAAKDIDHARAATERLAEERA